MSQFKLGCWSAVPDDVGSSQLPKLKATKVAVHFVLLQSRRKFAQPTA